MSSSLLVDVASVGDDVQDASHDVLSRDIRARLTDKIAKWELVVDEARKASEIIVKTIKHIVKQSQSLIELVTDVDKRAETIFSIVDGIVKALATSNPLVAQGWGFAQPLVREIIILCDTYYLYKKTLSTMQESEDVSSPSSQKQWAMKLSVTTLELKRVQADLAKQVAQNEIMIKSLEAAKEEAGRERESRLSMEMSVKETRAVSAMLTTENERLKQRIQEVVDVTTAQLATIESLQKAHTQTIEELKATKTIVADQEAKHTEMIESHRVEIESLEAAHKVQVDSLHQQHESAMQAKDAEYAQEIESVNKMSVEMCAATKSKAEQDVKQIASQIKSMQTALSTKEGELSNLMTQIEQVKEERDRFKTQLDGLVVTDEERNRVAGLAATVESLTIELSSAKKQGDDLEAKVADLERIKASVETMLQESREAHEKDRLVNKELENRIAQLEQELLARGQTIATLASEKSVKERELMDARSTIRALADSTEEKTVEKSANEAAQANETPDAKEARVAHSDPMDSLSSSNSVQVSRRSSESSHESTESARSIEERVVVRDRSTRKEKSRSALSRVQEIDSKRVKSKTTSTKSSRSVRSQQDAQVRQRSKSISQRILKQKQCSIQ